MTRFLFGLALVASTPVLAADDPTVLVLREDSAHMQAFVKPFRGELYGEIDVVEVDLDDDTTATDVAEAIAAHDPEVVVLMDNPTVELYREATAGVAEPPVALIVMALFLDEAAKDLKRSTGIYYEVPGVTTLSSLRQHVGVDVRRVGVVHRPQFSNFVESQRNLARRENFELVSLAISEKPSIFELRKAIMKLRTLNIDAWWVLNDNGLLTSRLMQGAWLPMFGRQKQPVVVGVLPLLNFPIPFGNYAVLPDHSSLGLQAAEQVWTLYDADWDVEEVPPELPIGVETAMKATFGRRHLGASDEQLDSVDTLFE